MDPAPEPGDLLKVAKVWRLADKEGLRSLTAFGCGPVYAWLLNLLFHAKPG